MDTEKVKVIIKAPNEPVGHIEEIDNTLEAFQKAVGGCIEVFEAKGCGKIDPLVVCNEDGLLISMEPNFICRYSVVVGTVAICGTKGAEFSDVPVTLDEWKDWLEKMGNKTE